MAATKSKKVTDAKVTRKKIAGFDSMVWVLNNLTVQELATMDAQPFDGERFSEFMEKCVDNGLDIKLSWDNYSDTYQISAIGAWQGYVNSNFAVSSRGLDIFDAWKALWFKIDFVANWDLSQFADKVPSRSKRG